MILIFLATLAVATKGGPPAAPLAPDFSPLGASERAEGSAILQRFRESDFGFAGSFYLEFQLIEIPRRGDERMTPGRLWGSRGDQGPVTRVVISTGDARELRVLLQNGPKAKAWIEDTGNGRSSADTSGLLFRPLVDGTEVTPFDLEMPFLFWPDATLVRTTRLRGRPTHQFLFKPPADFSARYPEVGSVRAYIDAQYNALVQTEILGPDGRINKTLSLVDLKKIGSQWMVKQVDIRNDSTRDKTRLNVTAVAFGLDLSPALFLREQLDENVAAPSGGRLVRLAP